MSVYSTLAKVRAAQAAVARQAKKISKWGSVEEFGRKQRSSEERRGSF